MRVLYGPLPDLDGHPKTVDSQGQKTQQPPLDPVPNQLYARSVKRESTSVNDRVPCQPGLLDADTPGETESQCENKKCEN